MYKIIRKYMTYPHTRLFFAKEQKGFHIGKPLLFYNLDKLLGVFVNVGSNSCDGVLATYQVIKVFNFSCLNC